MSFQVLVGVSETLSVLLVVVVGEGDTRASLVSWRWSRTTLRALLYSRRVQESVRVIENDLCALLWSWRVDEGPWVVENNFPYSLVEPEGAGEVVRVKIDHPWVQESMDVLERRPTCPTSTLLILNTTTNAYPQPI